VTPFLVFQPFLLLDAPRLKFWFTYVGLSFFTRDSLRFSGVFQLTLCAIQIYLLTYLVLSAYYLS